MEFKKNPGADIFKSTGLFFSIGLAVSISIVTVAMEWRSYEGQKLVDLGQVDDDFEEVKEPPQTKQPPPPPPKKVQPKIVEVPDDEEIEDEMEVELDIETSEDSKVEDPVFDDEPKEEKADKVFSVVQEQAMPKGGMSAFYKYVQDKLKYPDQARRMGVEGKVYVQFVVDKDGTISNVEVIKGIGHGCDDEAARILRQSPQWNPGKQRGRAVRVRRVLPITFRLD